VGDHTAGQQLRRIDFKVMQTLGKWACAAAGNNDPKGITARTFASPPPEVSP
jgi:hypothetical protein